MKMSDFDKVTLRHAVKPWSGAACSCIGESAFNGAAGKADGEISQLGAARQDRRDSGRRGRQSAAGQQVATWKMITANAYVVSRWFAVDQGYFNRHPDRHYRLRTLYPSESVALDKERREIPPRNANVLKLLRQVASGQHEEQAVQYLDKRAVFAALDTDEAVGAAFNLLSVCEVIDVRDAAALARVRETGRLQ
jgi:hypothetical protein